jgi:hypothetical protein
MKWITADLLERWAQTNGSEITLPEIVGDLIRATASDIHQMRFPSGEKGRVRGFDGHLVSNIAAFNVPDGESLWEFGTERDYKSKATADFEKRSEKTSDDIQANSTYVAVTPWTWDSSKADNKLEDWEDTQSKRFKWKKVIFVDGAKLLHWLDQCPAVAACHAKVTLKSLPQTGVRSIEEFWQEFSGQFRPRITEEVLLCERNGETESLIRALLGGPTAISFSADSPDEVTAFAAAAIRKADPEVRYYLEARTLVIDEVSAGRQVLRGNNLIYLLRGDATKSPGIFSDQGPTLIALGRQQRGGGTTLNRPSGYAMGRALMTMGIPENEALVMARGCGKSLTALARQYPGGSYEDPKWLSEGGSILPAILAGGWDSRSDADKAVIQELAKVADYFEFERRIRHFYNSADPPLDSEGTVWKVRAPIDAFIHAGPLIGQDHLEQLRSVMTTVFSKVEEPPERPGVCGITIGNHAQ